MEKERINVAEILRNCQAGMNFKKIEKEFEV